jgi:uncharacterized protein YutE (UPF0331/DUF86 family)
MAICNLFPEDKEFANQIAKYGDLRNQITHEYEIIRTKSIRAN